MAFTVDEFQDLLRLLREKPEWKAELRRELLGDEILSLPQLVRELSEHVLRLDESLERLSQQVALLVQAQARNEERFGSIDERFDGVDRRFDAVDERFDGVDRRFDEMDARFDGVDRRLDAMDQRFDGMDQRFDGMDQRFDGIDQEIAGLKVNVGHLIGRDTERGWREGAVGRFGARIRKSKVVTASDLARFEAADDSGFITPEEALAVRKVDLLMEGVEGRGGDARPALLVIELSATIHRSDVTRAAARAEVLRRVGYNAYGCVGGATIAPPLLDFAAQHDVEVFLAEAEESLSA